MSWITMADGHEVSLPYPRVEDFDVPRLAHNISNINRFNGATCRPYSVAEHSLLVLEIADKHLHLDVHGQMYALCHDLHEGITGDQATPSKAEIGPGWAAFEDRYAHLLAQKLCLITAKFLNTAAVLVADRMALAIERDQLLPKVQPNGVPSTPWPCLARVPLLTDVDLMDHSRLRMTWQDWRDAFIERYAELAYARQEKAAELASDACTRAA